jgi:amino acid transporter
VERHTHHDDDSTLLHKLGYAQVLYREMGGFSNFAISFTIISILAGCLTSYFIAFNSGGPVAITWGWLIVGFFVLLVALAMAEVASAMPTAGAIYYWSSKLGSPAWGWFSGWFNLIGQIGVTAAIDYGAAIFWTALLNLWFPGIHTDTHTVFVTFSVIVALHLLLNLNGVRLLAMINSISAWWHMLGVAVIVLVLIVVPDHHQSASFVFTKTINVSGFSGHSFSNPVFWFVFGIGLLMAQYTYTGYDASAHMSEETRQASRSAAVGVVMSVVMSIVFGWILLLAVTFAVPDVAGTIGAGAFDVTYIWQHSMSTRWAEFLLLIACVAQFFCGLASLTAASRMMFAFSRDGAVPGRSLWRKVSVRNRVPTNAVIAIAVLSWALARGRRVPGGCVDARPPLPLDQPDRRPLDPRRLHLVPDADDTDGDPVEDRLRLERRQLRTDHRRQRPPCGRDLVDGLRPALVQGADRAGLRSGAQPDRVAVRRGRCCRHGAVVGVGSLQIPDRREPARAGSLHEGGKRVADARGTAFGFDDRHGDHGVHRHAGAPAREAPASRLLLRAGRPWARNGGL